MNPLDLLLIVAGMIAGAGLHAALAHRRSKADREWMDSQQQLTRVYLDRAYVELNNLSGKLDKRNCGPAPTPAELEYLQHCRVMYAATKPTPKGANCFD